MPRFFLPFHWMKKKYAWDAKPAKPRSFSHFARFIPIAAIFGGLQSKKSCHNISWIAYGCFGFTGTLHRTARPKGRARRRLSRMRRLFAKSPFPFNRRQGDGGFGPRRPREAGGPIRHHDRHRPRQDGRGGENRRSLASGNDHDR